MGLRRALEEVGPRRRGRLASARLAVHPALWEGGRKPRRRGAAGRCTMLVTTASARSAAVTARPCSPLRARPGCRGRRPPTYTAELAAPPNVLGWARKAARRVEASAEMNHDVRTGNSPLRDGGRPGEQTMQHAGVASAMLDVSILMQAWSHTPACAPMGWLGSDLGWCVLISGEIGYWWPPPRERRAATVMSAWEPATPVTAATGTRATAAARRRAARCAPRWRGRTSHSPQCPTRRFLQAHWVRARVDVGPRLRQVPGLERTRWSFLLDR